MAGALKSAWDALSADFLAVLRIIGMGIAYLLTIIVSIGGSIALFLPLDLAVGARANGGWVESSGCFVLGFILGLITMCVSLDKYDHCEKKVGCVGVAQLAMAMSSTLIISGAVGLTLFAIVIGYAYIENVVKGRRARASAEQVELSQVQASTPSELERMVEVEQQEDEESDDDSGLTK